MLNRLYSFFFNRANQVRESFIREEQESPWRTTIFSVFYLFFLEIAASFLKFLILIFKTPYESFQLFTNQYTLPVCQYSYFDHKKFQKKIRLFSAAGMSSVLAATIIINLVLSLILPGQLPSYAKTVNGPWDDWSQTTLVGDPPVGSVGSLTYSPSGSAQIVGTGASSYLESVQGSYTATDDATLTTTGSATGGGFGNGSHSSTRYDSTNGNIKLGYNVDSGTGADGAYSCASGTCSLAGGTYNYTTFNISEGATVNITGSSALIIKATSTVTINGILSANGGNASGLTAGSAGPGGSSGGTGGVWDAYDSSCPVSNGNGTGGGTAGSEFNGSYYSSGGGGAGHGAIGGKGGSQTAGSSAGGTTYSTANTGGSGGGSGLCGHTAHASGGGGGGGSGSMNIAASGAISIGASGVVRANGGNGGNGGAGGGGGSGGRILIETLGNITNSGSISAVGGNGGNGSQGGAGGGGAGGVVILRDIDGSISGTISVIGGSVGTGTSTSAPASGSTATASASGLLAASSGIFTSATINLGAKADFSRIDLSQSGSGGVVKSWGANGSGQLGDGTTTTPRKVPVTPSGIDSAVALTAVGASASYALLSDGTVKAWGSNAYGYLGNNSTTNSSTPVTVCATSSVSGTCATNLSGVEAISGGSDHILALKSDGTVWGWGRGDRRQLGSGTTSASVTIPIQVVGVSGAIAIAAGGNHSLALLSDGTVKAWGTGASGQLGNNSTSSLGSNLTTVCATSSVAGTCATNLSGVVAIAATGAAVSSIDHDSSYALISDGTVKAWGSNVQGQLGDGTTTNRSLPVTVCAIGAAAGACDASPLSNVVAIAAGGGSGDSRAGYQSNFALALLTDGTINSWGDNGQGQLGNGTTSDSSIPVAVTGISSANPAISIVANAGVGGDYFSHSVALLADGTVKAWGANNDGQLGNNSTTNSSTPVTVCATSSVSGTCATNLSGVVAIAAGGQASFAITGGAKFQIAAKAADSGWVDGDYKYLPIQMGHAFNRAVTTALGINGDQYMKYKASFSTADTTMTPALDSIIFNYVQYPANASVSNLKFDSLGNQSPSGNGSVKWTQVSWVTNSATTSSIKVKSRVRVAGTEAALSSATWYGSKDGTTANSSNSIYFDLWGTDGYATGNPSNSDGYTGCSETNGKFGDTAGDNATKKTVTCSVSADNTYLNSSGNQWLEVEIVLSSDGATSIQVDAARATYSVNAAPEITSVAASQSTSSASYGILTNTFGIRDSDTNDGTNLPHGWVWVALQVSDSSGTFATPEDDAGHSYYNGSNFAQTYTISGDAGGTCIAVSNLAALTNAGFEAADIPATGAWQYACSVETAAPSTYTNYTITWNIASEQAGLNSAGYKIRVLANDFEGINPNGYGTTAALTIDTAAPTVNSILVDATGRATTLNQNITFACTDFSSGVSSSYDFSNDGTTWDGWNAVTCGGVATSVRRTLAEDASRNTKVYYRFRDYYGNTISTSSITTGQRPVNLALQDVSNVRTTPASYKNFISWEVVSTPTNGFASYEVYRCDAPVGDTTCTTLSNYTRIASATPTGDKNINYYTDSTTVDAVHYYRVATKDSSGHISAWSTSVYGTADGTQNGGEGGGGGDTTPPTVSSVNIPSADISQTSAIVTWTTNSSGGDNSGVFYSTNTSYGSEKSSLSYETSHSITLTGLSAGTTYNIQLKSTDASGNQTICDGSSAVVTTTNANNTVTATNSATYCPGSATYSFTTATQDTTAPVISNISTSTTSVAASVAWTTDESSDTCLGYRSASESSFPIEQCKTESVTSHSLTFSNLSPLTTYYVKVKSSDSENNSANNCYANSDNATVTNSDCPTETISDFTFTTTASISSGGGGGGGGGGKSDLDSPRVSDVKVSDVGAISATVAWKTNEVSSSLVQSGEDKDKLVETSGQIDSVMDHKIVLRNLTPSTKYFFKVVSIDAAGNIGSPDAESFTTKQEISAEELKGTEEEKKSTQQVLEDLKKQIQLQGDSINDPLQTLLESVSSLIPEPIIIGESPIVDETATSAKISWRTDKNSNSFVALSREDQYNPQADDPYKSIIGNPEDSTKEHSVNVENLLPATKYHFQVRSKAILGEMSKSKDFTFITKSELPEILKYLQKKTDNEKTATVYWQTSVPTDSVVKYTPYVNGVLTPRLSKIEGKPDMLADHEITIIGLDPGTVYQMEISGRDPFGNQVSKTLPDFTTAIDKEAPVISQVRIESAMITGKTAKIQTIVSWRTDEPSTGQVFFSEGAAGAADKMKTTALDISLTTIHTAVITEFNPASIYRIKIESKDESDNLATSRDFTILTPAQSQSIIDVIVKTFENTFGWVKNIKF